MFGSKNHNLVVKPAGRSHDPEIPVEFGHSFINVEHFDPASFQIPINEQLLDITQVIGCHLTLNPNNKKSETQKRQRRL